LNNISAKLAHLDAGSVTPVDTCRTVRARTGVVT
jgi:hypothetical protein